MIKILLAFLVICSNSFADSNIIVTKLLGNATVLKPHSRSAEAVYLGQKIPEDSSILTQDKSVVQISFPDKSTVNLGPNSKIVIEFIKNETKPNFLTLLKGVIRAKVTKEKHVGETSKEKFIIKSKSASLGVRGTEFQIGLNDDLSTTSLLTFEGTVEFSNKPISKEEIKENKKESIVKGELVTQGQFSNVKETKTETKILKPIEIDKTQFEVLAKNENFKPIENSGKIYETNKPVIDFETGKVIKDTNVKIDSSGKIIDERLKENTLKEVSVKDKPKTGLTLALENKWQMYQIKYNGNSYYLHNTQQTVSATTKLNFGYLSTAISFFNEPTLSHTKYFPNVNNMNFSSEILLSFQILSNKKSISNIGNYQYGFGVIPKTYFKVDDMNALSNQTESVPAMLLNLSFEHQNNFSSFIHFDSSLVDMDKLGLNLSLGMFKQFNSTKIGISSGVEKIKDQTSEEIKLIFGIDF